MGLCYAKDTNKNQLSLLFQDRVDENGIETPFPIEETQCSVSNKLQRVSPVQEVFWKKENIKGVVGQKAYCSLSSFI